MHGTVDWPCPLCALPEASCHGGQYFPLDVLLDPLPCYGALPDESCPTLALLASRSGQLVGPLSPLLLADPFSYVLPRWSCPIVHVHAPALACARGPVVLVSVPFLQTKIFPQLAEAAGEGSCDLVPCVTSTDGRGMVSPKASQRRCCGDGSNLKETYVLTYGDWESGQRQLGEGDRHRKAS